MFVPDSMICNYADETTIYVSDHIHEETIRKFDINILSNFFRDNYMKINGDKYHLMVFSNIKNTNFAIII